MTDLVKVSTDAQDGDIMTKGVDHRSHWRHVASIGLRPAYRG
jgi:hypothetical protein